MNKRIIMAGAAVTAAAALAGCYGPPTGTSDGTTYRAQYNRQYMIEAGMPIIFITYRCNGETKMHDGPSYNINYLAVDGNGDTAIFVGCGSGIAAAFPNNKPS